MEINALKSENAKLRAQLEASRVSLATADVEKQATTPISNLGDVPSPDYEDSHAKPDVDTTVGNLRGRNWKADYAKLSVKYSALSNNFKTAKEALQKRKNERDGWILHASFLEKRIKAAEVEYGIQLLEHNSTPATDDFKTIPPSVSADDGPLKHAEEAASTEEVTSQSRTVNAISEAVSESTRDDSQRQDAPDLPIVPAPTDEVEIPIKEEPSSDPPVIVTERVVKKRKAEESEEAAHIRRIKVERDDNSSSPIFVDQSELHLPESIDLGEVVQRTLTPRKRKELEKSPLHQDVDKDVRQNSYAAPLDARTLVDGRNLLHESIFRAFNSTLTPISVNTRLRRPEIENAKSEPLKKGLGRAISTLAEDGFYYGPSTAIFDPRKALTERVAKGRLDSLLNSPSIMKETHISRIHQRPRNGNVSIQEDLHVPLRRELPFGRDGQLGDRSLLGNPTFSTPRQRLSKLTTPIRAPGSLSAVSRGSPYSLRTKKVFELRLDDFKINPQANEGYEFAFSDVVRDKDSRACLPGCIDMHCCGKKFRSLALSQRPDPPLTATQRQEEQKLLENYLGDYAFRLAGMGKEERAELWVEAKTRELADKHGKHRQRYSRMRSPPGFWNADFPDTQELEADKEEAEMRERRALGERYREAMRPGGRWKFRDE